MSNRLQVLVTGATGKQGGTLARRLLERGHLVRALTRNSQSPAARQLAGQGAEVVEGDFEDHGSLVRAASGVDAVFAMSTPFEAGEQAETRHGIQLVDAAKEAGVPYLLYTSVANADQHTGIPHFESKREVEERLAASGVPHSVIAPVFFMENHFSPWIFPGLQAGRLVAAMLAERRLQQIAVADVGRFAALMLERREEFVGRRIDIASDELSGREAAEILGRVTGREIEYVEQPLEQLRAWSEDSARMSEWFDRVGYSADITGLRRDFPEVGWHRFEEWARAQDWSALAAGAAA